MSQEGANVCINYYSDQEAEGANDTVSQVESNGTKAIAVQADVGREEEVKRMVQAA
jgi:NAD(P)-dependent dehydrogenase (short-subunit alcohol dehydrogenase family)